MQTPPKTPTKQGYKHLTQADRDRIQSLLDQDVDEAEIGRIIGRHKSTVGREIDRNKRSRGEIPVANPEGYEATAANHKAYVRRLYAKYQGKKIQEQDELREYVIRGLKKHWNPDEISGAMKREQLPFYASKTAIYEWLYSEWGQSYTQYLYSKRHRPKSRKPKAKRHMIPDRVSIAERPKEAGDRSVYGHHEADTIVSGKRTGSTAAIATDADRKSRFLSARKIPSLGPENFSQAMRRMNRQFVSVKSTTYDNGIEVRDHAKIGVPSYFCDPYRSCQKGGIENENKMLRRYLPKGMDLATVSPQRLARIVAMINNKPRKILGYKSALQVSLEHGLLRQTATKSNKGGVALRG
jgi:transposase, IS30 family